MSAGSDIKPRRDGLRLPASPQLGPYAEQVVEGKRYRWCRCGLSSTQPWCDGSHRDSGMEPIEFIAPITGVFYMCGCKCSQNPPYCFGNCRGHVRRDGDQESVF